MLKFALAYSSTGATSVPMLALLTPGTEMVVQAESGAFSHVEPVYPSLQTQEQPPVPTGTPTPPFSHASLGVQVVAVAAACAPLPCFGMTINAIGMTMAADMSSTNSSMIPVNDRWLSPQKVRWR
jgi:hypothetical protein